MGNKDEKHELRRVKVLILGSGPAGLSAALYAARAEVKPVVIAGLQPGGQVTLTHTIENYPGFPDGIGGAELGDLFQKQAEHFGAEVVYDLAVSVDLSLRPFKVETQNDIFLADTLIICTGSSPNHLNIPGEVEFTGRGVSYCGTCDGWFFKGKKVLVVGGGDSALEEGIFLTRFASSVTIIHRRDKFRASPLLQRRVNENPKMSVIMNSVVTAAVGENQLSSVRIMSLPEKLITSLETDGLFIFIGHTPNTHMFTDVLAMNDGYLVVDERMRTSISGVYAAGEVADRHYRQVVTSAGMGAAAAIEAIRFLERGGE